MAYFTYTLLANRKIMLEYKRVEASIGSYTPSQFMELLNNYAKEGWELVDYWEHEGLNGNYKFRVVMKRKRVG